MKGQAATVAGVEEVGIDDVVVVDRAGVSVEPTTRGGTVATAGAGAAEGDETIDKAIDFLSDRFGPMAERATVGAVTGCAAGYAAKKAAKLTLLAAGAGFVALQLLAHKGYIDVHWDVFAADIRGALDHDGDGKVGREDVKVMARKGLGVLTHRVPDAAGFGMGFVYGFSQG
eukprot:m.194689 g.194689  ORF g.194689 m.194689 type:complete len:172 (+) comp18300_c0_seq5:199-714(+)